MTFQLNPEQERLVGQAIKAGVIRTANEVLEVGIEAIRQRLEMRLASEPITAEAQWLKEFHVWVHSHPTNTPLLSEEDISRESIYGMRGL